MRIFDVITFFNELDLLEMRFEILDRHVNYFVVNEATTTFSGKPKPLYFYNNRDRFKKFAHKIIHHVFEENKPEWDQWDRDAIHKNASMLALQECDPSDIIFYSDADEIPNFNAFDIAEYSPDKLFILYQDCYYYYLNTIWKDRNQMDNFWRGSKFSSWNLLKQFSVDDFRNFNSGFHKNHADRVVYIHNGGWHFSFLGGANNIRYKIDSYGHQELNIPVVTNNIEKNMKELKDPFFRNNFYIEPVEITYDTHPQYLVDNLVKYDQYIYKP